MKKSYGYLSMALFAATLGASGALYLKENVLISKAEATFYQPGGKYNDLNNNRAMYRDDRAAQDADRLNKLGADVRKIYELLGLQNTPEYQNGIGGGTIGKINYVERIREALERRSSQNSSAFFLQQADPQNPQGMISQALDEIVFKAFEKGFMAGRAYMYTPVFNAWKGLSDTEKQMKPVVAVASAAERAYRNNAVKPDIYGLNQFKGDAKKYMYNLLNHISGKPGFSAH